MTRIIFPTHGPAAWSHLFAAGGYLRDASQPLQQRDPDQPMRVRPLLKGADPAQSGHASGRRAEFGLTEQPDPELPPAVNAGLAAFVAFLNGSEVVAPR